jgi:two-component system, NtrC family, response regulator HydG
MANRILIIDDEEGIRFTFARFLRGAGYEVECADNYHQGMERVTTQHFDLVITDIVLGGHTGIEILRQMRDLKLACPLILITGYPTIDTATAAVRLGAHDYLLKPVQKDHLVQVTTLALQRKKIEEQHERRHSHLEAAVANVDATLIAVNTDLMVVDVHRAGGRLCGIAQAPLGTPIGALLTGCSGRCVQALKTAMAGKHHVEVQRVECHPDNGPKRVVSLTASPVFHPRGVVSGAVMLLKEESALLERERLDAAPPQFQTMIGKSAKMQHLYRLIESLKDIQTPVLITGESGTGKELLAEAIHYSGTRHDKPLVKVHCAALSSGLLESELFGHVRGAFTGAINNKMGRFQFADGGTIFLDEIGDIAPDMQLRLLRVLQTYEFERVGESFPRKVDVRVIAATNKNLLAQIHQGTFRADLYYRLKVMEIALPPLRERRDDIPLLVEHCLTRLNEKLHKKITAVSDDVLRMFMQHPWPGNVRQLEHALEHAAILCQHHVITVECLPPECTVAGMSSPAIADADSQRSEPQRLMEGLERAGWNKAKAARLLGMSRRTIYRKMQEHRIPFAERSSNSEL